MALVPNLQVAGTLLAVTTQNGSVVAPAVDSGDLMVLVAGKRASSLMTFPTAFDGPGEILPASGFSARIGWKWGALADSGQTNVVSTSGAGNLLHARVLVFRNVASSNDPLRGLITETISRNYVRAGSLTTVAQALAVAHFHVFDNVFPTIGGMTANGSWLNVASNATTTGSDGAAATFVKSLNVGSSGYQMNPNSTAMTANIHVAWTWQLMGVNTVNAPTASDDVDPATDNLSDDVPAKHLFMWRVADDAHNVSDDYAASVIKSAIEKLLSDSIDVTDNSFRAATIYALTLDDTTALIDEVLKFRHVTIRNDDGIVLDDGILSVRLLTKSADDATSIIDAAIASALRNATRNDSVDVTDAASTSKFVFALLADAVEAQDFAHASRVLARSVEDVLVALDEYSQWLVRARVTEDYIEINDGTQVILLGKTVATDGFDLTDDSLKAMAWARTVADSFDPADAAQAQLRYYRFLDDSLSFDDGVVSLAGGDKFRVAESTIIVTDATDLYKVRNAQVVSFILDVADGADRALARGRVVDDGLFLSDDKLSGLALLLFVADQISVEDGYATATLRFRNLIDAIGLSDSFVSSFLPAVTIDVRVQIGAWQAVKLGRGYDVPVVGYQVLPVKTGAWFPTIGAAESPVKLGGYN